MDTLRSPEGLDDVKVAILRQHTQLAQLLDELETCADAVLAKGGDGEELRRALDALHVRFIRHLEYEEKHLVTWLSRRDGDLAGDAMKALLGTHAEQRTRMNGLVHDRDVFGDARGLAREARAFVHTVRRDLTAENEKLRAIG